MRAHVSVAARQQRSVVGVLLQSMALASVVVGSVGIGFGVAAARAGSSPTASSTSPVAQADVRREYGALPLSFEPNVGQAAAGVQFIARGTTYSAAFESNSVVMTPREGGSPVTMRLEGAAAHPAITGGNQLSGVVNYLIGRNRAAWHTNVPTFADVTYHDVYPGIDMVWHGSQGAPEYDFVVAPGADPAAIRLSFEGAKGVSIDAKTGDLVVTMPSGTMLQHAPSVFQNEPGGQRSVPARFVIVGIGGVGFSVGPYDGSRPLIIDPTLAYSTYLGGSLNDVAYSVAVDTAGDAYVAGNTCSTNFPTQSPLRSTYGGPCPNNPYFSPASTVFAGTFGAAFVSKLNPAGTALLYSTYLGGSQPTSAFSVAVDSSGDAFVAGQTEATDFPTTSNAFNTACAPITQQGRAHPEAFAAELGTGGSALAYSTCVGGSLQSVAGSIAVHGGHIYLAGQTTDADFPVTANSVQTNKAGVAADFITVINPAGAGSADLLYSTYLGGSSDGSDSTGIGIAVDAAGLIYVASGTLSVDFPVTSRAYQPALANNHTAPFAGSDAYVSKINPAGGGSADLVYSTYLGGPRGTLSTQGNANGSDWATGVALGPPVAGSTVPTIYVTGTTASPTFPTTAGAVQNPSPTVFNCSDAGGCFSFLSKLNPVGGGASDLVYSTYVGSNGAGTALTSVAVDPLSGDAVVAGFTGGTTYPTANAIQPVCGCFTGVGDAVVSEIRPDPSSTPASNLVFSTYLGGTGLDSAMGVAVDGAGSVYVAGATEGTEAPAGRKSPPLPFPITPGAFQTTFGGGRVGTAFGGNEPLDAFASKIAFADTSAGLTVSPNPATLSQPLTYTVSATNAGPSAATIIATDAVPKGLRLLSVGAGCTSATVSRVLTVTCVLGPIAPGASAQSTFTLKAGKPGSYTNTVTVDGNAVDLTPADNTATVTATVTR